MSVKEIRDYFNQQIIEVDAEIKPWQRDVFGNNDVSKPQAQNFYNLVIGASVAVRTGNGVYDEYEVTLIIWDTSKRDVLNAFDTLYDKSLQIRNNIICAIDVYKDGQNTFVDIEPLTITPSEELTNDNTIKIEMAFTVRKGFEFLIGEG